MVINQRFSFRQCGVSQCHKPSQSHPQMMPKRTGRFLGWPPHWYWNSRTHIHKCLNVLFRCKLTYSFSNYASYIVLNFLPRTGPKKIPPLHGIGGSPHSVPLPTRRVRFMLPLLTGPQRKDPAHPEPWISWRWLQTSKNASTYPPFKKKKHLHTCHLNCDNR